MSTHQPYKGPINQPCSACSAGDYLMEHHDHDYVKPENRRNSATLRSDTYITPVLLLCAECKQPIRVTITTAQWIKCEWISPDGTCQACYQQKKQEVKDEREAIHLPKGL